MNLALCIACLTLALAVGRLDALPHAPANENVALSLGGGALGREALSKLRKSVTLRAASVGAAHFDVEKNADISALFDHYSRHAAASLGLTEAIAYSAASSSGSTSSSSSSSNDNDEGENGNAASVTSNAGAQHLAGISVDVLIGTPPQKQTILLNFLTSHFWLVGEKYILASLVKHRFDTSASTTFYNTDEQFKFNGSDFKAAGAYGLDNVQLGSLSLQQQRIGVANSAALYFPLLGVNGVLGMAAAADQSGESSLTDLLTSAGVDATITIYHNPLATVLSSASNALFVTFGGADETLCKNDWEEVFATNEGHWEVDVYGLSIDENPRRNELRETAIILSTLPITLVPHRTIKHIVNILGAVAVEKQMGVYSVRCTKLPTLYLNIGDHRVPIEPENYIVKVAGVCFLRIFEISEKVSAAYDGVQFVLAEPLLRSNCVKFDPQQRTISFATPIPQPLK